MEQDITLKIDELRKMAQAQEKHFAHAMTRSAIIFGVLVVFVAAYTTIVFNSIAEMATPETVSELVMGQVRSQVSSMARSAGTQMKPAAQEAASKTVEAVESAIPAGGAYVRNLLSEEVDSCLNEVEQKQMKVIGDFLDVTIAEMLKNKGQLTDGSLSRNLSDAVGAKIDGEMRKLLNDQFYASLDSLDAELKILHSTPNAKVTRKQYSEKMFILYWLRMLDAGDKGVTKSPFQSVVSSIDAAVNQLTEGLNK